MHERADLVITEGGASPRRFFQGCSLFGLEQYGEAFDRERFKFGYAAGRLELHPNKAQLYLWPRVASKLQAGFWRLVRDVQAGLLDEEAYLPPHEIPLKIPCKGPGELGQPERWRQALRLAPQ